MDEPVVEEPEEGGQIVLSEELADYLNRIKRERLFPTRQQNNQIVLYSPGDSIKSRIVEITDEHESDEEENEQQQPTIESNSSSPLLASPTNEEEDEQMEID